MAKLAILALAFATLFAFTSVTALRTTITTTTIGVGDFVFADEEQQTCHRQVQKEWVRDCKKYLTKSSPYSGDVLKMPVMELIRIRIRVGKKDKPRRNPSGNRSWPTK
ncbi:hypothetical protein Tco_0737257 [Tanacetum coccineum]